MAAPAPRRFGMASLTLTDAQFDALRNLARKKAGDLVGWIAIAEARELTELGFAARNRSGWQITDAGVSALNHREQRTAPPSSVVAFPPRETT
jgi:hypothetical protein